MAVARNAVWANLDGRPCRLSLEDSIVMLAPRVACTELQHRTGSIVETEVHFSQRNPVTTCKQVLQVHVHHLP